MSNSRYFAHRELMCHCGCCRERTVNQLRYALDRLREAVGQPLELSCAYRCPEHNREVGGVENSQHVLGTAADILVPNGMTVDGLADTAANLGLFDGIGRYYDSEFVHVDVRSNSHVEGTPDIK